jgi:hypothetical protein
MLQKHKGVTQWAVLRLTCWVGINFDSGRTWDYTGEMFLAGFPGRRSYSENLSLPILSLVSPSVLLYMKAYPIFIFRT